MSQGLIKKFSNPGLKSKLLETQDSILVEGNIWGDTFWGVDIRTNQGRNTLGILLMKLRDVIKNENIHLL
jgi:hypothetical protein